MAAQKHLKVGLSGSFTRRNNTKANGRIAKIEDESNGKWLIVYTGDAKKVPPVPEDKHKDFTKIRPSEFTLV